MRPPPRRAISAIILAGGQGHRLGGRDKARLRWRGRALVDRLIEQLRSQAAEIVVVRARPRGAWRPPTNTRGCHDRIPGLGPVSGLEAGLRRARRRWCLTVPVDGLNPPRDLAAQLARGSRHGGHARQGEDEMYLHALVNRQRRKALTRFIAQGGRSASNACQALGIESVPLRARRTIWSINTPEQWRHARWCRQ